MPRIALGIEYDGSAYFGWQDQCGQVPSIQAEIEKALSRVADESIVIVAAGRTDKGVHALEQVVHFDSAHERSSRAWLLGVNSWVSNNIRVRWVQPVSDDFHARQSALKRHYRYVIFNHPTRPSLLRQYVGWYYRALDVTLMREACHHWVGEHDFSSFRAAGCQSVSPVRHLYSLSVERRGEQVIVDVVANAFLHHMVRNLVGVLCRIGAGLNSPEWAKVLLEAKDRKQGAMTAPASGLYLVGVEYPHTFAIPRSSSQIPGFIE